MKKGLLSGRQIEKALARTLTQRFATGQFDPPEALPWSHLGNETINSDAHRTLARKAAVKGVACNPLAIAYTGPLSLV